VPVGDRLMSKLTFTRRDMPLSSEYRPMFKIVQILLILYLSSRGYKSSLLRLHLINWAIKDSSKKSLLLESSNRNSIIFDVWGLDPAINFALQYALEENLITLNGTSYALADKGLVFIKKYEEEDIENEDYNFLKELGNKITEKMVLEISGAWV